MLKLNNFIQLLSVAALLLFGHPDKVLAQIVFSPTNTVALSIGGPGQTVSTTLTVTSSITGAPATNVAVTHVVTQDNTNWLCPSVSSDVISISIGGCGSTTQLLANTTYNGHFNVTADQGSNSVSVSVQVGGGGTTSSGVSTIPSTLTFSQSFAGQPVVSQTATVYFNGGRTNVTSVTFIPGSGPGGGIGFANCYNNGATVTCNLTGSASTQGTYTGTATITTSSGGMIGLPISLTVGSSAFGLSVSQNPVTLTAASAGAVVTPQFVTLNYNGSPVTPTSVTFSTATGASWLSASIVGSSVQVTGNAVLAGAGTSTGSVTVNTGFYGSTSFQVNLNIGAVPPGLSAIPNPVILVAASSGAAVTTQYATVYYNGSQVTPSSVSYIASTGGSWLQAYVSGNSIAVSGFSSSLGIGTYSGTVTVYTNYGSTSFQVTLNVGSGGGTSGLSASPTSLLPFSFQIGGSNPAAQAISMFEASSLGIPTDTALTFSASATTSSGGSWLSVTPTAGATPGTVSVSVNPSTLAAGTYSGTVTISAPGGSTFLSPFCVVAPAFPSCGPQVSLPVTLTVSQPTTVTITAVQNAASSLPTSLSPGLNIVIYGSNMGPATLAGLQLGSSGAVTASLSGTKVTFDGIPAPIIYTKSTQVSVMAPYEVAGKATTSMVVSYNGGSSAPFQVNVANTSPGIYTLDQSGAGQGAILNQDGTLNGPQNPEIAGHIIQIYLTGEGQTMPGVDGAITPARLPVPMPIASVQVTIGGVPVSSSKITFYGEAPGVISGVMQVDAEVPPGAGTGSVPVIVTVGGHNSQANVTVSLR